LYNVTPSNPDVSLLSYNFGSISLKFVIENKSEIVYTFLNNVAYC